MLTFEINKTFASEAEYEAWIEANCPNRTYQGHPILSICSEADINSDTVTITEIWAF